jgi:hypothetical protein
MCTAALRAALLRKLLMKVTYWHSISISGVASTLRLVTCPGPARNLAEGMQIVVAVGVGVLPGGPGAKLDVLAYCITESRVVGHLRLVEGRHVEVDEALTLPFRDPQAAVDCDQVLEPELAREAVGPAKRFNGERRQVVDVIGLTLSEERNQQRVGKHLRVEDLFQTVDGRLSSCALEQALAA